jgi:hypothetical protein
MVLEANASVKPASPTVSPLAIEKLELDRASHPLGKFQELRVRTRKENPLPTPGAASISRVKP